MARAANYEKWIEGSEGRPDNHAGTRIYQPEIAKTLLQRYFFEGISIIIDPLLAAGYPFIGMNPAFVEPV